MHHTTTFEDRLVRFLHETFPDSREMPAGELEAAVGRLIGSAQGYGLNDEASIAVYVTTAYLLGEHFDTHFPAAADILNNPHCGAGEKAGRLENWTGQLFQALEGTPEPDALPADPGVPGPTDATLPDYLNMEAGAGPFGDMAEWLVQRLVAGDAAEVIGHFSPNFREHLGLPTVERVFAEQLFPFFAGGTGLGNGRTITYTHDAFGSQGYAFYLTLNGPGGAKPFVVYLVREAGRIVLANIVLDKEYSG